MNFYKGPAHTSARGYSDPPGCRAGRRTTRRSLRGRRTRIGFKCLEGQRVGKVRVGCGRSFSDIYGTLNGMPAAPSGLVVFSSYEVVGRALYLGKTRAWIGEATWKALDRASVEILVGEKV